MVPESLDSVNITTIRKFSRKCWRYMDLYRKGIDGKLVEYAVKKYKSHKRIPKGILEELNKLIKLLVLSHFYVCMHVHSKIDRYF